MKKLGIAVLAWVMIIAMCTTVSAATMQDASAYVPNPLEMELAVSVGARNSGTDDAYAKALPLFYKTNMNAGVDYKATLDMKPIRDLFDEGFITTLLLTDAALRAEFNSGIVATTVQAAIRYPEAAIIKADLTQSSVGVLDAGGIFSETGRTVKDNTLTITYVNRTNLTAGELTQHKDTYLKDITFTLEDAVAYGSAGAHAVSVTLSGKTEIKFATKTQVIEYLGGASHIVTSVEDTLTHMLEVIPAVPATCHDPGSTEGIICRTHGSYGVLDSDTECHALGTVKPTEIPKLSHSLISFALVPATCGATGMKAHETCIWCKTDFVGGSEVLHESLIIPATGAHTEKAVPGAVADCVKSGLTPGSVCKDCGYVITKQSVIPATGHTPQPVAGYAATCTEDGLTDGEKCACGVVLVSQKVIPATGHNFGDWTTTKEPTENAVGQKERTCLNACGTKEIVEIPKLVHTCVIKDELAVITKAPTCTETGLKQNYCACGKTVGAPVAVPAAGHKLSHISEIPATCVAEGTVEHYHCVICNKNYRDAEGKKEIKDVVENKNRDNHGGNEVAIPGKAATCVKEGLSEGKKCKACSLVLVAQEILPKAPHVLETVEEEPAKCEANGIAEHKHCAVCNADFAMDGKTEVEIEALVLRATGHAWGDIDVTIEPTETTEGAGTRTCANDASHVKPVTIAKKEHVHNETVEEITKAETCTESGLKRKVYSCCGVVLEDNIVIPPHAHTPKLVKAIPATCEAEGVAAYYTCTECRKLFSAADMTKEISEPEKLAMLEHDWQTLSQNAEKHVKKCRHCKEVVNTKKNTDKAEVKNHGGMKNEKDKLLEEIIENVHVETDINIEERVEVSSALYNAIPENVTSEKVVLEIVVEKVTTHEAEGEEKDIEREIVQETNDLMQIVIKIPADLRGMEDYAVYRLHGDDTEVITTEKNNDGEYIEIQEANHQVILHVKKSSEYALVGFEEENTPSQPSVSTSTKPSLKAYTVSFRANGGTVVESIQATTGSIITAPVTTREGYVFAGWYTDAAFTKLFDFATPIKSHTTLYAKWIAKTSDNTITLVIGNKTANVYGTDIENDVAPKIVNGRTMLPIRFVAEALGATVSWDGAARAVSIRLGEKNIKLIVGEAKAVVDGKEVALDVASFIENDRTYLPLRFIAENLGAVVEWDENTQTVTIFGQRPDTIILTIGKKEAVVFGAQVTNDVAPQIVNDRTMLPIRFVAEALGATVLWDENAQTVSITLGKIDIRLTIGEAKATVNGNEVALDAISFIENSRTYLPLRFVAENLGATVEWIEDIQTVVITKN